MANDGRFIYDILTLKNKSFETGTVGATPTDWTRDVDGDGGSLSYISTAQAFNQSRSVEMKKAGTDTRVLLYQNVALKERSKEYIAVAVIDDTVTHNAADKLILTSRTAAEAVLNTTTTLFTAAQGDLMDAKHKLIWAKLTEAGATLDHFRITLHVENTTSEFLDYVHFGKVLDLIDTKRFIENYGVMTARKQAINEADLASEVVKIAPTEKSLVFDVSRIDITLDLYTRILDLNENHLDKGQPFTFFFDLDDALTTKRHHELLAPDPRWRDVLTKGKPYSSFGGEFRILR